MISGTNDPPAVYFTQKEGHATFQRIAYTYAADRISLKTAVKNKDGSSQCVRDTNGPEQDVEGYRGAMRRL